MAKRKLRIIVYSTILIFCLAVCGIYQYMKKTTKKERKAVQEGSLLIK